MECLRVEYNGQVRWYDIEIDGISIAECCIDGSYQNYISDVRVHSDYRNQGYAKKMLSTAIATSFVGQRLTLQVFQHNIPAQKVYKALGFTIVETDDNIDLMEAIGQPKNLTGKYYIKFNDNIYEYDSEVERNEMALAFYEEYYYERWYKYFNNNLSLDQVDEEELYEYITEDIDDDIIFYDIINL